MNKVNAGGLGVKARIDVRSPITPETKFPSLIRKSQLLVMSAVDATPVQNHRRDGCHLQEKHQTLFLTKLANPVPFSSVSTCAKSLDSPHEFGI